MADGPLTAEQLARATQAHEPSLYRVLRLLASLGVLTEHGNRSFGLTVLGERLRAHVPASMRSWAMLVESLGGVRAFDPIIETVRNLAGCSLLPLPTGSSRDSPLTGSRRADPGFGVLRRRLAPGCRAPCPGAPARQ